MPQLPSSLFNQQGYSLFNSSQNAPVQNKAANHISRPIFCCAYPRPLIFI